MSKQPLDHWHVSSIDKRLKAFDDTHPPSKSQQAEIAKYQKIHQLRDEPTIATPEEDPTWDNF